MKNGIAGLFIALSFLTVSVSQFQTNSYRNTQQVVTVCEGSLEKLNSTVSDMIANGWETESQPYFNGSGWCQHVHD
ncbi:MAG: hypothetical protein IPL53_14110 [Ignavibacteria bacterium]|nr:hypothetical protein [Ignavibacteria bacterium]